MSGAAKMRVRKADDLAVIILVASAVFIGVLVVLSADIIRLLVGVRRELDRTEWHGRTRIRMSHLLSADERVDVLDIVLLLSESLQMNKQDESNDGYFFHIFALEIVFIR